jgi:hypothetical protein
MQTRRDCFGQKPYHTIVPLRIYGEKNVKNQNFVINGTSNPANIKTKPASDPKREERLREREERFCLSRLGRGLENIKITAKQRD